MHSVYFTFIDARDCATTRTNITNDLQSIKNIQGGTTTNSQYKPQTISIIRKKNKQKILEPRLF